jgi:hypothetical protein
MVEAKVSIWKVNCMDSAMFGFGICSCNSHQPTIEEDVQLIASLDIPSGMFEGFISSNRFGTTIYIPLKKKTNLYGEEVSIEELRIWLLNK